MSQENNQLFNTGKLAGPKEIAARDMFYEAIVATEEKRFSKNGSLNSMVFLFLEGEGDTIGVAPMATDMFMQDDESKDMLSEMLHELAKKLNIIAIGMFAEAWGTRFDKESEEPLGKKEEICFFSFESENLMLMKIDKIIRFNDSEVTALKIGKIETDGFGKKGRFAGILKDLKKVKNN